MLRPMLLSCAALAVLLIGLGNAAPPAGAADVSGATAPATATDTAARLPTTTPIKHLVIIYDENVSFDHYFATYPKAANPSGEPAFQATGPTPTANTLTAANLLSGNPNFTNKENGANATDPFRLDRTQAATADQNHAYAAEQQAYNAGKTNLFPKYTGKGTPGGVGAFGTRGQVMGYYDGNTVTALWNYAQHFAMSDDAYSDTYGPSTPGALEVVSGQTNGVKIVATTQKPFNLNTAATSYYVEDGAGGIGMINDVDPGYDLCSKPKDQVMMDGRNIGTLLNQAGISWGGFMGGFDLGLTNNNGTTGCQRSTYSDVVHAKILDYIPHHNWFQYHASTANPTHARPAATADIGYSFDASGKADPANHEYDLKDFYAAVTAGGFPAVSYIKPPAYQDAHAGYSDPLDEQEGLVDLINFVQHQPGWKDTAILVVYDDSDGWYDHAFAKPSNPSADAQADQLDGPGECGTGTPLPGVAGKPVNGRCGPGTRVPFLVISPWAKPDAITHDLITQASVLHFIEDNWLKGERLGSGSFDASAGSIMNMFDFQGSGQTPPLFLDAKTGEVETAAQ